MRLVPRDLQTLFWLQWKLTQSMFRGRRGGDVVRLVGILLRLLTLVVTLPMFVLIGAALAAGLILLPARAAYELVMIVNTGLFLIWLVLPASYNSQIVERFEMARLFAYPISFPTIVVGSTLISLLTVTGLWTVPLLIGEVVGLTYHQPLAFPLVILGAVPVFALLVLSGRIMDDFFDLVAGDRRLRGLVLALLSLPFMTCWLGQYAIQYATDNYRALPEIGFLRGLERLSEASGLGEFLEILGVSRLLIWLPPGWTTAGMGSAVSGDWVRALAYLAGSTGFIALLLWVHARITRRLMQGAALKLGTERVRSRRWRMPGPPAFSALLQKDWSYLWRSPMPRRLVFSTLVMVLALAFPLLSTSQEEAPALFREVAPIVAVIFVITLVGMAVNMGMAANYFGSIDREGFATLAVSGVDRRYVLMSSNLAVLVYTLVQYLLVVVIVALVTRVWIVIPLGLYFGLCLQIGSTPAYNFAAIIGPYRAQLKFTGGRQRGNMWGMLAWLVSAPPVLLLIALPYVLWPPALLITLPMGLVYSVGLYVLTLRPLARMLQRREHDVLAAVTARE